MRRRSSGYITISVSEYIDEVDDEELLAEVQSRKLVLPSVNEPTDMDIVRDAYAALMRNNPDEAASILSRLVFPKWKSVAACTNAYQRGRLV